MILTEIQRKELEEASRPLIKFLNTLSHPHVTVSVDTDSAELSESISWVVIQDYIKD